MMMHFRLSEIGLKINYRVLITDEATDDVFNLVKYIQVDLCNPDAANKLYTNLNREVNTRAEAGRL